MAESERCLVIGIFGVRRATNHEQYLGLPMMVGRSKKQTFANYVDRINCNINNWNFKFLSMGGKETLIKSFFQALTVYAM